LEVLDLLQSLHSAKLQIMGFEEVSQTKKEGDGRALPLTGGSATAVL
jgi:hypothetical protein